jgi:hypothetical protein
MLLSWNCFRCCTVKFRINSLYIFWTWNFLCICPKLYPNFSYLTTFLFEQHKTPQKFDLCQLFSFDRFLPMFVFAILSLSFEFFWSWNFLGSCYSSICYICGAFDLKPEAKRGWLYVMLTLMLLIELCLVLYEGSFQV